MKSFLAPGVLLMRRLSLVRKFLLVSFFMLLPLAYTGTLYLSEVGGRVNVVLAERDGLRYINPLLKLSRLAQDHRGATYVIAKGNPELKQFRSQVQEKIRSVVQEIDRVEEELGARYGSAPRWRLITEKLKAVVQSDVSPDSEGVFQEHIALVANIHGLIDYVTLKSNLLLDADLASYHLMSIITSKVPSLSERLAIARGVGINVIMRGELMADDRVRISVLEAVASDHFRGFKADVDAAIGESLDTKSGLGNYQVALSNVSEFLGDISLLLSPGGLTVMTGDVYFKSGTEALDSVYGFADKSMPLLETLLTERIQQYRTQNRLIQAVAFVCLALALYFFFAFYYAVKSGIAFLMKALKRVAGGDLTGKIETRAKDEIGSLTMSLKETQQRLATLTLEINRAANQIYLAANQIADGNENLSRRTESQASTLEQTSASLEELTAAVQRNAESASDANNLTQDSARVAESGRAAMKNVAATMAEIETSATQIGDIISLMDNIAFQTNILALNAAVEAARAGEQGRGFAVVAAEVRNLAHHSASAAKQIKGLVVQTREKVSAGVVSVDETLKTIQESLVGIQRLAGLMNGIASASREQSEGIAQVNRGVLEMDDANQQNAAMVEQASAATESLRGQASILVTTVGRFNVGQRSSPTPDAPSSPKRAVTLPLPRAQTSKRQTAARPAQGNEEWTEF